MWQCDGASQKRSRDWCYMYLGAKRQQRSTFATTSRMKEGILHGCVITSRCVTRRGSRGVLHICRHDGCVITGCYVTRRAWDPRCCTSVATVVCLHLHLHACTVSILDCGILIFGELECCCWTQSMAFNRSALMYLIQDKDKDADDRSVRSLAICGQIRRCARHDVIKKRNN